MTGTVIVVPATVDDARGIARVQVETWRAAYRGIVHDAHLDGMSVDAREERWIEQLRESPERGTVCYVARSADAGVVGFAGGGPNRVPADGVDAELYALYVLPRYQKRGLGAELMRAVAGELRSRGYRSLTVTVLAANPARGFYEALGGVFRQETSAEIGGRWYPEVRYGWADLEALLV